MAHAWLCSDFSMYGRLLIFVLQGSARLRDATYPSAERRVYYAHTKTEMENNVEGLEIKAGTDSYRRAEGKVGHEVSVHNVEVDVVCALPLYVQRLLHESRHVGRKHGRPNSSRTGVKPGIG